MRQHLLQSRLQVFPRLHAPPGNAVAAGHGHVIGALNVHERVAAVVEQLLPLPYHAQETVVEDDDFHIDPRLHDGAQLLNGHLNTPIADNGHHRPLRCPKLGPDGRRQRETHRAQPAAGDVAARVVQFGVAAGHHLVLAHVGHDDGLALGLLIQLLHDFAHRQLLAGWE